jgi:hypothetical protein
LKTLIVRKSGPLALSSGIFRHIKEISPVLRVHRASEKRLERRAVVRRIEAHFECVCGVLAANRIGIGRALIRNWR